MDKTTKAKFDHDYWTRQVDLLRCNDNASSETKTMYAIAVSNRNYCGQLMQRLMNDSANKACEDGQ